MDRLLLEGMTFFGRHGVLPAERELGARFQVDVAIESDASEAARTDDLDRALNYVTAYEAARDVVEGEPCRLLETVAERIAARLLALAGAERVTVTVRKRPPVGGEFRSFGVEIVRPR